MDSRASSIALATYVKSPGLYAEEAGIVPRIQARGLRAEPVVWSASEVDWRRYTDVVLRSTWDYHERLDEFYAWLERLERLGVRLHNSFGLVRWNMDKRYLRQLEGRGAAIVPTSFVERGAKLSLAPRVASLGWDELVLKPTLSGGAFRTYRFRAEDAAAHQAELEEILVSSGALLQPFLPEVQREGEWSLYFFGGEPSHAVLKRPAPRDFRVQEYFGGTFARVPLADAPLAEARKVLTLLPEPPLYVRIDGVVCAGQFLLMEVEAIEPYLYSQGEPLLLERYADAVARAVQR